LQKVFLEIVLRLVNIFLYFQQVLKRELAEIRESFNRDNHVSISTGEKHKRELEALIKEMEQIKRENKRIKEEMKQKGKILDYGSHGIKAKDKELRT